MEIDSQVIDVGGIIDGGIRDFGKSHGHYTAGDSVEAYIENAVRHFEWNVYEGIYSTLEKKGDHPCDVREVVLRMLERGLPRENVSFRKNTYRVVLPNSRYHLRRMDAKLMLEVGLFKTASDRFFCSTDGLSSRQLSDLIFAFDHLLPTVREIFKGLEEGLREDCRRKEQDDLARRIAENTVKKLCEDKLKPLNIKYEVFSFDGGDVAVSLERVQRAQLVDLPLDELIELLSDRGKVISSLKDVPPEDVASERRLHFFRA